MKELSISKQLTSYAERPSVPGALKFSLILLKRILLVVLLIALLLPPSGDGKAKNFMNGSPVPEQEGQAASSSVTILVDDFKPQLPQGSGNPYYFYNRLNGDRGTLYDSNVNWGNGQVRITVKASQTKGGIYESLNHPDREHLPIDFSAVLPPQILPAFQSQITGINVHIVNGTSGRLLKLELKDENNIPRWSSQITLSGGPQVIGSDSLPALGTIHAVTLWLDNAAAGDYVTVDRISFTATTQITDSATKAFVWSYGMLLNNWDPGTGLVRDSAKNASGEFDAVQSTGSLAAATILAEQLGVINRTDALAIVNKIGDTLLNHVPRSQESYGLWPHWVNVSDSGDISIVGPDGINDITGQPCQPGACTDHNGDGLNDVTNQSCDPSVCMDKGTEWSSVDTTIAAISLLDAQNALGLDTSSTELFLSGIEWNDLQISKGISHGYDFIGKVIPHAWDTFGGETWLAELAYAASMDYVSHVAYASPPTADGSGFIDELAWLFVQPPSAKDYWADDWSTYRADAANTQVTYYSDNYPGSCYSQLGLFGLSASEVPEYSLVTEGNVYQAFGKGGQFVPPNNGLALLGAPVVIPHYSALIASLRPAEATRMWDWLITQGYFSPLNNVESLMFSQVSNCNPAAVKFNDLKGSWNLALQTLGWGRYLVQHKGATLSPWLATSQNPFLHNGYLLLTEDRLPIGSELDEDAAQWQIYKEENPKGEVNNVPVPSKDGRSLRCAIVGGDPYSNVHCYRNLPADAAGTRFVMEMSFMYRPKTSFGNPPGDPSIVQGLEFTMNKYQNGERYEWAVQWDNVNEPGDTGAPKWRYWGRQDPLNPASPLKWLDLGISGSITSEPDWHTLKLEGEIIANQVHYTRLTIDGTAHSLNNNVLPAPTNEPDKLAIAVQLDGNSTETPYEVLIDQLTLDHIVISGNVGVAGATLSYTDGTAKTVTSDAGGNYSILVPTGWTGTFRPYKKGYSFTPMSKSYNNIQSSQPDQNYAAQICSDCADINVLVGGISKGAYTLAPSQSTRDSYTGLDGGPVKIGRTNSGTIIASERINLKQNGAYSSYAEVMGIPASKLSDSFIFPWYNNTGLLDSQLRFGNVGAQTTTVTIKIGGVTQPTTYTLAPNESTRVSFSLDSGPVEVKSSNGVPIIAALRINLKSNTAFSSYSEFLGMSASDIAATRYIFPWYNNTGLLDSQLRFGNVGNAATTVTIKIGGVTQPITYTLAPNQSTRISYSVLDNGPVEVTSSGGVPITAAMRINLKSNSIYSSYTELMGLPGASLTDTRYLFPWYNNTGLLDSQLRFGNVGNATTTVRIKVNGVVQPQTYTLAPNESTRVSLTGMNSGPVEVYSSGGVPIIAAMRINLKSNTVYSSYYEFMGMPAGSPLGLPGNQLSTTYWFPWYNNTGLLDSQLRFGVP